MSQLSTIDGLSTVRPAAPVLLPWGWSAVELCADACVDEVDAGVPVAVRPDSLIWDTGFVARRLWDTPHATIEGPDSVWRFALPAHRDAVKRLWTAGLALGSAIDRLMEEHGAQRARIAAAIGPTIHQNSYEVGPEFEGEFTAADASFARFFVPGAGDRFHFDLPGFCASRLEAAGVTQIETLPLDTYAESTRLHSHRRSVHEKAGDYGRNCSVIML